MGWCQFAVTDVGFFRSLKRTFQAVFFSARPGQFTWGQSMVEGSDCVRKGMSSSATNHKTSLEIRRKAPQ